MNVVTEAQLWALVVGFFLPPFLAVLQQPHWTGPKRVTLTLTVGLLAGAATAAATDQFSLSGVVAATLVVTVTTIATYQSIWRASRIAPWIESRTTRRPTNGGGTPCDMGHVDTSERA